MRFPRVTTWVAIADGGKALLLEVGGPPVDPELTVISKEVLENPPDREQKADRPGRYRDSGPGQRSAFEEQDWHQLAETKFAKDFAAKLDRARARGSFDRIVLVAPNKVRGTLRAALTPQTREAIHAEVDKDLTNHPVPEILDHIRDVL